MFILMSCTSVLQRPVVAPVATFSWVPLLINGTIHITYMILLLVAAYAAEAELGAFFLNAQGGKVKVLGLILEA